MEIRPALQQVHSASASPAAHNIVSDPSTTPLATVGTPAGNAAMRWSSSGAQLQDALQAGQPTQASDSMQVHTLGESVMSRVLGWITLLWPSTGFEFSVPC